METTLSTKGQLVIPKQLRQVLGWSAGDRLELRAGANGELLVRRQTGRPFLRLRGSIRGAALTKELELAHQEELSLEDQRFGWLRGAPQPGAQVNDTKATPYSPSQPDMPLDYGPPYPPAYELEARPPRRRPRSD